MRPAGALGLILAIVMAVLAVAQVDGLQDSIETVTSGGLLLFAQNLTLLTLFLAGLIGVLAIVGVMKLLR